MIMIYFFSKKGKNRAYFFEVRLGRGSARFGSRVGTNESSSGGGVGVFMAIGVSLLIGGIGGFARAAGLGSQSLAPSFPEKRID